MFSCSSNEPRQAKKEIETATNITTQTKKETQLSTPSLGMNIDEVIRAGFLLESVKETHERHFRPNPTMILPNM